MLASRLLANPKVRAAAGVGGLAMVYALWPVKKRKEHVVVVGGGTAGIGVAAMLGRGGVKNITLIEPKAVHYYQPLWTLVGGGVKDVAKSSRPMEEILAKQPGGGRNVQWLQKSVESFSPEANQVQLQDGTKVDYDYLVVAGGMKIDWDKIPGLQEGLEDQDSTVVSIYDYKYADKTHKAFEKVVEDKSKSNPRFLFTMAPMPIKCAGAPQKIMWLLEDAMRKKGLRDKSYFGYFAPGASMFGVPYYSEKLEKIRQERKVDGNFQHELVAIDPQKRIATFLNKKTGSKVEESFDFLHVTPHMSAPGFIKSSSLSDEKGWLDVDKHTLQSKRRGNVFGLGDCTNTPNSKTAAAITAQAPVLVHNLKLLMDNSDGSGEEVRLVSGYQGYASCPLILARGRTMLAEFGYGGKIMETFGRDTGAFPLNLIGTEGRVQQRFFYFLKEQLFPFVYWNLWTRGMWYGTTGIFKPGVKNDPSKAAAVLSTSTKK